MLDERGSEMIWLERYGFPRSGIPERKKGEQRKSMKSVYLGRKLSGDLLERKNPKSGQNMGSVLFSGSVPKPEPSGVPKYVIHRLPIKTRCIRSLEQAAGSKNLVPTFPLLHLFLPLFQKMA